MIYFPVYRGVAGDESVEDDEFDREVKGVDADDWLCHEEKDWSI
jgi:hypothetical protein